MMIPRLVFFTKGVVKHKDKLQSFELALRVAGIEKCNLVRVSSIFPPLCKIVTKEQGVPMLKAGQVVFCVMSDNSTNEPNRMITASVGMAVPSEPDHYGYLSEHHAYGETEEKSGDYAEDRAATMLDSTVGAEVHQIGR